MNQCLCRGFATALFVSAVATPLAASAQQIHELEASLQASRDVETTPEVQVDQETLSKVQTDEENFLFANDAADRTQSNLVRVIPHTLDANQAATLYVSDIPVLTFVGGAMATLADKEKEAPNAVDPTERATETAIQLDEFYEAQGNPETITARWDAPTEGYVIALGDTVLVRIDDATILPDTTRNFEQDTLQAANRLRRLLGGAEPLTEVEGKPEPTTSNTAASGNWSVTSVTTGRASWYGPGFHGRRTASGEVFNQNALTAAHRTLPFGTLVRVTNLQNNEQVTVRINDRGPYSHGRILDLSAGAARAIGLDRAGVGPIRLEVLAN